MQLVVPSPAAFEDLQLFIRLEHFWPAHDCANFQVQDTALVEQLS
jgi:hypothetical protein